MTEITPAAQQRVVDQLAADGMHATTARNVVQHVVDHGPASPWAREVQAAAVRVSMRLLGEKLAAVLRTVAPAMQQVIQAMNAAAPARQQFALAPPLPPGPVRPAWQSPYGPAQKGRRP